MLMASIVASMMMGGFLLTVSGDVEDETSMDMDEGDADGDLYAGEGDADAAALEGWGDLLTDLMDDEDLASGPEAINHHVTAFDADGMTDAELELAVDDDGYDEDNSFDMDSFAAAFAGGEGVESFVSGPLTEDGTEIVIDDFVPGEDQLFFSYEPGSDEPMIEIFGDPAGNALVFADGHLTIKVMGADGQVLPEDIVLMPEADDDMIDDDMTGDADIAAILTDPATAAT